MKFVAVLAHELGHFKLNHIRLSLVRSFLMTGLMFFALGQMLPIENLYLAFGLQSVSNYGALVVFFSLVWPYRISNAAAFKLGFTKERV